MKKFLLELVMSVLGSLLPKLFRGRTAVDAKGSGALEEELQSQIEKDGWKDA